MSTYWGYRCKQDGETSEHWFNHGEELLRDCIRAWPYIRKIDEVTKTDYIDITLWSREGSWGDVYHFLMGHYEHGLELHNEYGDSEPLEEEKT